MTIIFPAKYSVNSIFLSFLNGANCPKASNRAIYKLLQLYFNILLYPTRTYKYGKIEKIPQQRVGK